MTAPTPLLRVVVLVSGRGSNLKAIAARADAGELPVRIEAVVVLDRARYSRLAVVDLAAEPPAILAWRLGSMPSSAGP